MGNSDCKLILLQIGSPATLSEEAIKVYLTQFLSNRKVVDIHPIIWLPILKTIILRFRSKKLLKRYEKIWDGREFMLVKQTRLLWEKLQAELKNFNIECDYAFYYGKKTLSELQLDQSSHQTILVLPLFPQYSRSTWGIAEDFKGLNFKFLPPFYAEDFYINNVFKMIDKKIDEVQNQNHKVDAVLISFHSAPLRQIKKHNDPYLSECEKTFQKLKMKLEKRPNCPDIVMCYQSRFGKGRWAGPLLSNLVTKKYIGKNVVVASPSFVSDSLETIVEINEELKKIVEKDGGKLHYVECLNTDDEWVKGLAKWVLRKRVFRLDTDYIFSHHQ